MESLPRINTSVRMPKELEEAINKFGVSLTGIAALLGTSTANVSLHKRGINKITLEWLARYAKLFNDFDFNTQAGAKVFGTVKPLRNGKAIDKYQTEIHATLRKQKKEEREWVELDDTMLDAIETGKYDDLFAYLVEGVEAVESGLWLLTLIANEGHIDMYDVLQEVEKRAG